MRCATCNAENLPDARFCASCGASFALPCPRCGHGNLPGSRFCTECGSPLTQAAATAAGQSAKRASAASAHTPAHLARKILAARGAIEGERKLVTVVFADIKGSTELIRSLDAEEA